MVPRAAPSYGLAVALVAPGGTLPGGRRTSRGPPADMEVLVMKLTDKAIAALVLPADKRDVIFFDDALTGFGYRLRAGAGGRLLRTGFANIVPAADIERFELAPERC